MDKEEGVEPKVRNMKEGISELLLVIEKFNQLEEKVSH